MILGLAAVGAPAATSLGLLGMIAAGESLLGVATAGADYGAPALTGMLPTAGQAGAPGR